MNHDSPGLSSTLEEIADLGRGYRLDEASRSFRCLHCSESFDLGLVYPIGSGLATAERAAADHVLRAHGGPLEALLAFGREKTGLSEVQEGMIRSLHAGASDVEIAKALGGKSQSAVRNQRFQLRRREAEAKILIALMALVADRTPRERRPLQYQPDLPVGDERLDITELEAKAIEGKYLDWNRRPALSAIPKKHKEKLVLLRAIAERFERDRDYREPEVNDILLPVWSDYVSLRRYLIEFRFLEREPDGSRYRRR